MALLHLLFLGVSTLDISYIQYHIIESKTIKKM
nr:MAG TPA: hypothetical protein [Caudoviricetes sp.]